MVRAERGGRWFNAFKKSAVAAGCRLVGRFVNEIEPLLLFRQADAPAVGAEMQPRQVKECGPHHLVVKSGGYWLELQLLGVVSDDAHVAFIKTVLRRSLNLERQRHLCALRALQLHDDSVEDGVE